MRASLSGTCILMIAGDGASARELGAALGADCRLLRVDNPEQALELLQRETPDAVLLGLRESVADGHALLDRLAAKADGEQPPLLMLGGSEHDPALLEALQHGAVDHLADPLLLPLALLRVHNHVAGRLHREQWIEQSPVCQLTGIANRRRFNEYLPSVHANALRRNETMALLLLDVDCFSAYNERYGERAGDEVLMHIGRALASAQRRPLDLFAHFGGGRFACVLPNTDLAGALAVAELHRSDVADLDIEHADSSAGPTVTISLGVVATTPVEGDSEWQLLETVEAALLRAKQDGRNRVAH